VIFDHPIRMDSILNAVLLMQRKNSWIRGGFMTVAVFAASTATPMVADAEAAMIPLSTFNPDFGERSMLQGFETARAELSSNVPDSVTVDPFPGRTYGNYDSNRCLDALDGRAISYVREGHARGIETPVRLTGALHGVYFRGDNVDWETSARREVMDCRLVLALDDLADLVARHGVTEVRHFGIYRGDAPLPARGKPLHHLAGLAIDVSALVKPDGTSLDVRRDFRGRVGGVTCPGARAETRESTNAFQPVTAELRRILCDVADGKTFHQILTPNHDVRHRDHFHLEVMRKTSWTLVE
jgi:hypothetical protein